MKSEKYIEYTECEICGEFILTNDAHPCTECDSDLCNECFEGNDGLCKNCM